MEQALVERAGLTFESIAALGLRGKNPFASGQGLWILSQGYLQSRQIIRRFRPDVLFVTGGLMVVGEPVRELLSLSFWLKMSLIIVGAAVAAGFQVTLGRNSSDWEKSFVSRRTTKCLAMVTFLVWCCIVILGRLIAYDHVWGRWSLSPIT